MYGVNYRLSQTTGQGGSGEGLKKREEVIDIAEWVARTREDGKDWKSNPLNINNVRTVLKTFMSTEACPQREHLTEYACCSPSQIPQCCGMGMFNQ